MTGELLAHGQVSARAVGGAGSPISAATPTAIENTLMNIDMSS
jgi:hypothetical protein